MTNTRAAITVRTIPIILMNIEIFPRTLAVSQSTGAADRDDIAKPSATHPVLEEKIIFMNNSHNRYFYLDSKKQSRFLLHAITGVSNCACWRDSEKSRSISFSEGTLKNKGVLLTMCQTRKWNFFFTFSGRLAHKKLRQRGNGLPNKGLIHISVKTAKLRWLLGPFRDPDMVVWPLGCITTTGMIGVNQNCGQKQMVFTEMNENYRLVSWVHQV